MTVLMLTFPALALPAFLIPSPANLSLSYSSILTLRLKQEDFTIPAVLTLKLPENTPISKSKWLWLRSHIVEVTS